MGQDMSNRKPAVGKRLLYVSWHFVIHVLHKCVYIYIYMPDHIYIYKCLLSWFYVFSGGLHATPSAEGVTGLGSCLRREGSQVRAPKAVEALKPFPIKAGHKAWIQICP